MRVKGDRARLSVALSDPPRVDRLATAAPERFVALFESSAGAAAQSRCDIPLADPGEAIDADTLPVAGDFFDAIDARAVACRHPGCDLPFVDGWLLYLGYEMGAAWSRA